MPVLLLPELLLLVVATILPLTTFHDGILQTLLVLRELGVWLEKFVGRRASALWLLILTMAMNIAMSRSGCTSGGGVRMHGMGMREVRRVNQMRVSDM